MSRTSRSQGALLGTVLALLLASCSRQHSSPEVGDSVTNWLAACSDDGRCRGEARCLKSLCTVSCADARAETCAALAESAICDLSMNACDLPCEAAHECEALGADYTCRSGRCRADNESREATPEPGSDESGVEGRTSVSAIPLSNGSEPSATLAEWSPATVSERTEALFDRGATVPLSDLNTRAVSPFVSWEVDHWRVAWSVDVNALGSRLGVADVYPEGRKELRQLEIATAESLSVGKVYEGYGDRVAYAAMDLGAAPACSIQVTHLGSAQSSTPLRFPCNGSPDVAPIPNSTHWLVTWTTTSLSSRSEEGLMIARYDPNKQGFSAGPWQFASYALGLNSMTTVVNGDAWAWPAAEIPDLYHLGGLAEAEPPAPKFVPQVDVSESDVMWRQVIAVTDGALVFERSQSYALHADGTRADPITLPVPIELSAAGVTRIPERGLLALCSVSDDVTLFLLDEQGHLVSEPEVFEPSYQGSGTYVRRPAACDLAWSGSELLVAWSSTAGDETEQPFVPTAYQSPLVYAVQARIAALPERVAALSKVSVD